MPAWRWGNIREFRAWAAHHKGGDLSIFKTQAGSVPFFDDSSVAQIRKDIKEGGGAATGSAESGETDLYPAVFLQMAQDLDESNREIEKKLHSQVMQEHALMKALKGDEQLEIPDGLGAGAIAGDQDAYMISERTAAWAHIMLADDLASPMWLTHLPAALENLVERAVGDRRALQHIQTIEAPACDASRIARCREALADFIEGIAGTAWDGEKEFPHFTWDCETGASGACLSLYIISGVAPRRLAARYLAADGSDVPGADDADGGVIGNTVVGVVAF